MSEVSAGGFSGRREPNKVLVALLVFLIAVSGALLAPMKAQATTPIVGKLTGQINTDSDPELETVDVSDASVRASWEFDGEEGTAFGWTDGSGEFELDDVPDSISTITLSVTLRNQNIFRGEQDQLIPQESQDFLAGIDQEEFQITNRAAFNVTLTATPIGSATIGGVVRDAEGVPIEGIQVYTEVSPDFDGEIWNDNPLTYIVSSISNQDGEYLLQKIIPGKAYSLSYLGVDDKQGKYFPGMASTKIREGQTSRTRDLLLSEVPTGAGQISGTLTGDNLPLSGYTVKAKMINVPNMYAPGGEVTTNPSGSFAFNNLPAGTYEITVWSEQGDQYFDYWSYWRQSGFVYPGEIFVQLLDNTSLEVVDIALEAKPEASASVAGRLVSVNPPNPLAGANVYFEGTEFGMDSYSTTTSQDGYWTINNVRPGIYSVSYSPTQDYFMGEPQFVEVFPNQLLNTGTHSINLIRPGNSSLTVSVRSEADRKPISGAEVRLLNPQSTVYEFGSSITDSKGVASFTNLPNGTYSVQIDAGSIGSSTSAQVVIQDNSRAIGVFLPEPWSMSGVVSGRLVRMVGDQPVPVANTTVYANYSVGFGRYGLAGDGYSPFDITDEDGVFQISDVLLNVPLELTTENSDVSPLQLAVHRENFGPLTEENSTLDFGDIELVEGHDITGTFVSTAGLDNQQLRLELYNASNMQLLLSTNANVTGGFRFENVPTTDCVVYVRDQRNLTGSSGFVGGYLTEISPGDYAVLGSSDDAKIFSGAVTGDIDLGEVQIDFGGSISGQLRLGIGGDTKDFHNRAFAVIVYRLESRGYVDAFSRYPTWSTGWNGGGFTVSGLPPGIYKLEVSDLTSFYETSPKFIGVSGLVDSLDEAESFSIYGYENFGGANAIVSVVKPEVTLNAFDLDSLDGELREAFRDQVAISNSSTTNELMLNVGDQYAGEWLFVELSETDLVPAFTKVSNSLGTEVSDASIGADWYQVDSEGKISVSGDFSSGQALKVVVQEAGEYLVGWTAGALPTRPGGVVISNPEPKKAIHAPRILGKARVGNLLRLNIGDWGPLNSDSYKYSWFICKTRISKASATKPPGCKRISGEVDNTLRLSKLHKHKYVLSKVRAIDGFNVEAIFTASTSKVKKRLSR